MNKVLISWIAHNNDFRQKENGTGLEVNKEGATYSYHKYFYEKYEKHILLSASKGSDSRAEYLVNALKSDFSSHEVEVKYMDVPDVINLELIRSKIEPLLLSLKEKEIDIFFSPGTSIMQIAWVMEHAVLNLKSNLVQVRPKKFTRDKKKPERLFLTVDKDKTTASLIIKQSSLEEERDIFRENDILITESMKPLYARAYQISQAKDATVLIQGETGTGKENIAKYIHKQSIRRSAAFCAINCSAIGDQLLESRLFGFKKGSFTDAIKDTVGLIEEANGGTVFLDEIGDISAKMQQSLLRVLQEKEITPIGGKPKKIDVRFVAATNKDLLIMCEKGAFRWDLYYRLAVVDIELPALRERGKKELKKMIQFLLKRKKKKFNASSMLKLPNSMMSRMLDYKFPGNLRELENLIERLYILGSDNTIDESLFPKRMNQSQQLNPVLLKEVEKQHIQKILAQNNFNLSQTAKALGVVYNTLKKKVKDYQIAI